MAGEANNRAAETAPQTEGINQATREIDRMSALEIARTINQEDAKIALAVETEVPKIAAAIEGIVAQLKKGGRLIYMGAGTSGRLGVLDASECPPTYSTPPELVVARLAGGLQAMFVSAEEAEDDEAQGRKDAEELGLSGNDALVGITASGTTPYVMGALAYGREVGALTIGLTCNKGMPIEQLAEITISPEVGPEVVSGSTRMKAGTAQKMVLNMLSTGAMILLGKTFGNLMVDVKPTNAKLRRRANVIVQRATGVDEETATHLLQESDGETKTAIVVALAKVSPAEARARLEKSGGVIRKAL
jgi:N-acetylmuramic acid 6-phosphate etherase